MRPIFGFSSCAAPSRIHGCARSAARRFTRISATWIAESLAEAFRPSLSNPPPADAILRILERDPAPFQVFADLVRPREVARLASVLPLRDQPFDLFCETWLICAQHVEMRVNFIEQRHQRGLVLRTHSLRVQRRVGLP